MGLFDATKRSSNKLKKSVKEIVGVKEIKETSGAIKDMAKIALSPNKVISQAKQETFEEAKLRLGLNDLDILKTYKNYVICFYLTCIFFLLVTVSMFYLIYHHYGLIQIFATMSIAFLLLANLFKFSFRAYQIRCETLYSAKVWFNHFEHWFPPMTFQKITEKQNINEDDY